ncbi:extradiol dioxygenase [Adhaeribacter arboris]|uniref:Extradiol dioxygenase n=1 Tax=Adhaeribacter arboris TaxID=2072846 RepID=A0A2T2YH52_9BACT|nr:VOC family protein [Adhaeribacter arboris]PSR54847.1 extradiol dioxygenase [Adhaeribacter arboris]
MMTDLWINLPVKNLAQSKEFFTQLGFTFNQQQGNTDHSACLLIGQKNVVVMLFDEPTFKGFTNSNIASADKGNEVLLSLGVESKEEVDELAKKAIAAGGSSNHKPKEMQGWMYGCVFTDLDGHKWNVLYLDKSKMPN